MFINLLGALFALFALASSFNFQENVHYLEQGEFSVHNRGDSSLKIYCYGGRPKYIIHLWQTVLLQIDISNDNYILYDGSSPETVLSEYKEHHSSWGFNLFTLKQKRFKLNPFNQSCVGIESREKYTVHVNIMRIDYWKIIMLGIGISLFLSAKKLSRNVAFHYMTGISFGIFASFIILVYFISKLFPRKPMMYGVAICGWSIGIYFAQLIWENLRLIFVSYQSYVMWYTVAMGLISFIVLYRMGPVKNQRTLNIIQWTLQAVALACIFFSSELREASTGQIFILLTAYNIPQKWVSKSRTYWKKKFPPKVKLLSNDEYYHQGVKETTKALDDLRSFCSSPECNQWKTVLRLKEAKRFASFMEGQSHLTDEEMLEYESSIIQTEFTDDEEDEAYTDED